MLAAAASLGVLLAAGEAIRWNASVETQARGRNEPAGEGATRTGLGELDLHARLELSTQDADGAAALTYLPSFLVRQVAFGVAGEAGNATRHGGRLELLPGNHDVALQLPIVRTAFLDRLGDAAIPDRARTHPWFLLSIVMSVRANRIRESDVDACIMCV